MIMICLINLREMQINLILDTIMMLITRNICPGQRGFVIIGLRVL